MTYLVLARKWRPRSFDTLIGQDHVVRALTHALSTQRLHHAWLFTGTRGVGKTTLSRILAKSLNCETGITATPCGVCRACTEIDSGRFVDYVELDAASNRGVDEMTQLLEQAVYAPGSGRFKVYMIDEVHMLTGHAFNAMLKTLEEPPPHVKFILATTDPQKIPVTVLSRCLQFNLKQMTGESIVSHLQGVLDQEGIQYETPALRLLAQAASGSMRDALSLTDQAIAYSAGNLSGEAVRGMLGTIDQRHLIALLQALSQGSASQVLAVADELAMRGLSYSGALADLAILLSRIAIEQRIPGATSADDPLAEDIAALAQSLHPDQTQLFYSVAVHSRSELTLAPDEYAGFVMACLRMLSLVPPGTVPPPSGGQAADGAAAGAEQAGTPAKASAAPAPDAATLTAAPAAESVGIPPLDAPAKAGGTGASSDSANIPVAGAPKAAGTGQADPARAATIMQRQGAASMAAPSPAAAAASGDSITTVAPADDIPAWEDDVRPPAESKRPQSSARATARQDVAAAASPARVQAGAPEAHTAETPSAVPSDRTVASAAAPAASAAAIHATAEDGFETMQSAPATDPEAGYFDEARFVPDDDDGARFVPAESDGDDGADAIPGGFALREDGGESTLPPGIAPARKKSKTPRLRDMTSQAWPALAAKLPLSGLAAELARQSEWLGGQGDQVRLRVAIRPLTEIQGKARLRTVLSEHFGTAVQLEVEFGHTGDETAHAVAQARRAERQKDAEQAVVNDPFVQELIANFGARVVPGSVSATEERAA
ncbi:DNA polymerase III subunit gamma/tau [Allopusillimonas ginsengisoli]|uniref:DNA polymerase III subunit gamma/tau n=1 Tax=Allopusillimonas ginsengisoli TaxID=453575 RepID=UPI0010221732|nr:DNA polymerase III subunit gamma/tau [Allopusillimonas ginsengisoli]TEA79915.1 DNA polymerase III subunit gamma/tau [Allopusillimonas ginsengisoli]